MANEIKLKRGSGSDPQASDLVVGEIAVRTDNGSLFTKKDDGNVQAIGSSGVSDGDKGDITVSSSGSSWTIDNLAVTTGKIANDAVTNDKLADDAVDNAQIANNAVQSAQIAANAVTATEIANTTIIEGNIADDAVTYAKIQNVSATNRILGRDSSGAGVIEEITPANLRTMLNIEDGATGDLTAAEILTLIKTVDGSGSGLDADTIDGISSASFLRSDADDTTTGKLSLAGSHNDKLTLTGSSNPFIRFQESSTNKAYIEWNSSGYLNLVNQETSEALRIASGNNGLNFVAEGTSRTVWHSGNDGATSGLDADLLDGQEGSYYLNYNNFSNTPTIPTNNNQLTNGAGYVTSSGNTVIGTDSDINTSGATVIDQLNMTDGVITSHSTRTLTLANLGYTGATNANYITNNNQLTNGAGYVTTNTTYSADGDYGMNLSGTTFRMEDDRRRNSSSADIYTGNTHDYCFFDASHGIRFYTSGSEEMRLENDGDLHVDGNVTAYSTTVSDLRLKKDVEIIKNPLDIINKINGYTFTYKKDNKKSAGVVAQEVEKVFPQAVLEKGLPYLSKDEEKPDVYKTVEYDQIVGLLLQAVKELKAEVDSLKGGS